MAFRMDMHVHTAETSPCGKVPAADVVALYKQRGYDGIVITDHYFNKFFKDKTLLTWREQMDLYLAGYRAAKAAGDALGLMVLQGMELRFKGASDDFRCV